MMHTPAVTSASARLGLDGFAVRHRALDERTCVVTVEGELDLASAPALKSELAELLGHGWRDFVLDLSQVAHMDSTGLGVLIGLQVRLKDDGRIAIAAAPHNVLVLFEVTRLDGRFDLFPTVDDATAHLGRTGGESGRPALSPDAAMVVGLASTALPFAESSVGEAERWLRILHRQGDAARALCAAGVSNAPIEDLDHSPTEGGAGAGKRDDRETVASVIEQAARAASGRGAKLIGTTDVLIGVMAVYGEDFDRILRAYGSDGDSVKAGLSPGAA
jgi:anti-sigma B factor antagonist